MGITTSRLYDHELETEKLKEKDKDELIKIILLLADDRSKAEERAEEKEDEAKKARREVKSKEDRIGVLKREYEVIQDNLHMVKGQLRMLENLVQTSGLELRNGDYKKVNLDNHTGEYKITRVQKPQTFHKYN